MISTHLQNRNNMRHARYQALGRMELRKDIQAFSQESANEPTRNINNHTHSKHGECRNDPHGNYRHADTKEEIFTFRKRPPCPSARMEQIHAEHGRTKPYARLADGGRKTGISCKIKCRCRDCEGEWRVVVVQSYHCGPKTHGKYAKYDYRGESRFHA